MNKFVEKIPEIVGWVKIAAPASIIGLVLGACVYWKFQTPLGKGAGISLAVLGLIIGAVWATKQWKKTGTIAFLSRIEAMPELDDNQEKTQP